MSNYYKVEKDGYVINTDPSALDIQMIHEYLSKESYWAQNIPLKVVTKGIANSIPFGLYEGDKQIGFARVTTDKASFAYLGDVFILQPYRGRGLSKWLIQTIHTHPELQGLRRWLLVTRDAHGLYEQNGWTLIPEKAIPGFMQKHNPDVYKQ